MPGAHAALLIAIHRSHRNLDHGQPARGEHPQKIIGVAEARPEIVERQTLGRSARNRRVAALAIVHGQAGSETRGERQEPAGEAAQERHVGAVRVAKAIALHVAGLAERDRQGHLSQIFGRHLRVPRHDHEHVAICGQSGAVAAHDRGTDASVLCVHHQLDARVPGPEHDRGRAVIARIVDHDDQVHESGHAGERALDQTRFAKAGNDDGDLRRLKHARRLTLSRRAGKRDPF